MEEREIEASLELYKTQLTQVEQALLASGNEGNSDLVQLRADLQELVSLTEEGLLSLKKSNILTSLEKDQVTENNIDNEYAAFQAAIAEEDEPETSSSPNAISDTHDRNSGTTHIHEENAESTFNDSSQDTSSNISKEFQDVIGTQCRAPYVHEWGSTSYHNAIITHTEVKDDETFKVSVMFCNPTHQGMLPCQYHLDGKCRFTAETCKFSHGHIVDLQDLKEYEEPDYSTLMLGSSCLALYSDGLWYRSVIVDVLEDHQFTVKYDNYDETSTLDMKDILPLDAAGSDSDDSEGKGRTHIDLSSESEEEDEIPVYLFRPSQSSQALGEWEAHTKGIGSKLMAKMGYIMGDGLGKQCQGRAEPVPIQLIPQGKSLDKIMELKERAGDQDLFDVSKRKKKKSKKQVNTGQSTIKTSTDVFNFINKKLGGKKGNVKELVHHLPHSSSKRPTIRIGEKDLASRSDRKLNVQLLKTEEEIKSMEKELERLKQSLQRHENKDEGMTKSYKMKIAKTQEYIDELRMSEKTIQSHKTKRSNNKKLTIF